MRGTETEIHWRPQAKYGFHCVYLHEIQNYPLSLSGHWSFGPLREWTRTEQKLIELFRLTRLPWSGY